MYKLFVSTLAHRDIANIVDYIANRLEAPATATNFLDEVQKCYNNLKRNPFIYERCGDVHLSQASYRRAVIKNYVLIFRVDETAKTVNVYRLFHGTQNYLELI